MPENLKRFRIEFTVDVHHEGVTKAWDWSNDDIKDSALQELECMSPAPVDITFSEVENPWHTGTPTEEGWYLLAVKHGEKIQYNANRLYSGGEWFYSKLGEVLAYQKIDPYKEKEDGHTN